MKTDKRIAACVCLDRLEERVLFSNIPANVNITAMLGNQTGDVIARQILTPGATSPASSLSLFSVANLDTQLGLAVSTGSISDQSTIPPVPPVINWSISQVIANGSDGLPEAFGQATAAIDSSGNIFLAYLDEDRQHIDILMKATSATSFSQIGSLPGNVSHPQLAISATLPAGATTPTNYVWIAFQQGNEIALSQATDVAGAVSTFQAVHPLRGSLGGYLPSIAAGEGGTPEVAVVFQKSSGVSGSAIYETTNLNPSTFSFGAPSLVANSAVIDREKIPAQSSFGIDAGAQLAIGSVPASSQNRIYVGFVQESPAGSANTDIYIRYKDPSGVWSSPMRVNDDTGLNSQFDPALSVDPINGDVALSWYDARQDMGTGGQYDYDEKPNNDVLYYAAYLVPAPNGLAISPNQQISQGASNALDANSLDDLGESTSLVFYNQNLYSAWSDNSDFDGSNPNGKLQELNVYSAAMAISAFPAAPTVITLDQLQPTKAPSEKLLFSSGNNIGVTMVGHRITFQVAYTDQTADFSVAVIPTSPPNTPPPPPNASSPLSISGPSSASITGTPSPKHHTAVHRWVETYSFITYDSGTYSVQALGFADNGHGTFPAGVIAELVVLPAGHNPA